MKAKQGFVLVVCSMILAGEVGEQWLSYLKTTVSVDYFWLKQLYTESAEIIGIKYRFYKPRVINKRCCDLKQTHLCPKFFCDKNRTVWNYL